MFVWKKYSAQALMVAITYECKGTSCVLHLLENVTLSQLHHCQSTIVKEKRDKNQLTHNKFVAHWPGTKGPGKRSSATRVPWSISVPTSFLPRAPKVRPPHQWPHAADACAPTAWDQMMITGPVYVYIPYTSAVKHFTLAESTITDVWPCFHLIQVNPAAWCLYQSTLQQQMPRCFETQVNLKPQRWF